MKFEKGPYSYNVHTDRKWWMWGGMGVGILKFAMCLWILLFLNNTSIVNFCGWEFTELAIICGILTLSSFKKGVFFRNGYFYPMRSISIVMKQAFFIFKLFFRTKVSQNAFNFNQIESYVCSIFYCDTLIWKSPV